MERSSLDQAVFGRVKNRIDLIGRVIKVRDKFVCLEIPDFRGYLEYPSNLVEFLDDVGSNTQKTQS